MSAMFIFIIIVLAFVLASLLVYFLCRFAKIYRTLPSGERVLVGYLWKWPRTYIIYDGIPLLGADRIGFIDQNMHVFLKAENAQHNYVEVDYGSVDDQGVISDPYNNVVATCDSIGQGVRGTCVNDSYKNEIAYATTGFRKGDDLLVRAAATGALCALNVDQDSSLRSDVRIGFKDLALPSALIFMLLFVPLALLGYDTSIMAFLGDELSYVSYMMLAYGFICWLLYFIKKCMTMRNRSLTYILGLVDRNVGVQGWNVAIIILGVLLSLSSIFITNYTLLPLFLVITVGFAVNTGCFKGDWKIVDPCATWGTKWGKGPSSGSSKKQLPQGSVYKSYSWGPILEARGISHNNEDVVLIFNENDYDRVSGRVRLMNPFAGLQGVTFEELQSFSHKVIDGCDGAAAEEKTAIVAIINSAYQICQKYNLADFELYDLVLAFCQKNIEYVLDEDSEPINKTPEYFRFAAETLFDGQGDCDCKSVLAYRIFKALNVDVEFALVKSGKSEEYNHVAIVLRKTSSAMVPIPDTYLEYEPGKIFCETTGFGHAPGAVPADIDQSSIYFLK